LHVFVEIVESHHSGIRSGVGFSMEKGLLVVNQAAGQGRVEITYRGYNYN